MVNKLEVSIFNFLLCFFNINNVIVILFLFDIGIFDLFCDQFLYKIFIKIVNILYVLNILSFFVYFKVENNSV